MLSVSPASDSLEETLREVVETLAVVDRPPCSPGERQAAEWLAARLLAVGGVEVALEDEPSWGIFSPTVTGLGLLGMVAAALTLRRRRATGALLAIGTIAGIIDEAQNGPRLLRRLVRRRRTTVNLVARVEAESRREDSEEAGVADGGVAADGSQGGVGDRVGTLVVLAHHDAPQTGMLFDQTLQKRIHERAPQVLERFKTPPPQWWLGLAGPLATLSAALRGRRSPAYAGMLLGAVGTVLVADVWRSPTVPGANDNLSGVAALVALAELLRERPLPGLRVLLVSCGAEETLQDGVRAFVARHRDELEAGRTWFANLDTIGSPHLISLEAEGPVWMESYTGPWLRDLLTTCAERVGVELQRGFRARSSTDSVIPSRAGYPIVTLASMTDWRSLANYHLPSDVPANLDYGTVADATRLVYELARSLADGADGRAGREALKLVT
jgi:peptidase M28-like protein